MERKGYLVLCDCPTYLATSTMKSWKFITIGVLKNRLTFFFVEYRCNRVLFCFFLSFFFRFLPYLLQFPLIANPNNKFRLLILKQQASRFHGPFPHHSFFHSHTSSLCLSSHLSFSLVTDHQRKAMRYVRLSSYQ